MKVVINNCYGVFGLSNKAYEKLIEYGFPVKDYVKESETEKCIYKSSKEMKWMGDYWDSYFNSNRTDDLLIKVIEELGSEANCQYAKLKIIEIPDNVKYEIDNYDGMESIHELHRVWS